MAHRAPVSPRGRVAHTHRLLAGSERAAPDAYRVGVTNPAEPAHVTVVLRPGGDVAAHPDDIAVVAAFAQAYGLTVTAVHDRSRSVKLEGTVARMSAAFGVDLVDYEDDHGVFRSHSGPLHVHHDIADMVVTVLGLDTRRAARHASQLPLSVAGPQVYYTPPQLGRFYNYPQGATGAGQTIGVVELGGGYTQADLAKYFARIGVKRPSVSDIYVDGGVNKPDRTTSTIEVALDINVIGALAPGATQIIYFAPNSYQGFYDAIAAGMYDKVNKPSVISISWLGAEKVFPVSDMIAFDALMADAGALGITIFAACGDHGALDSTTQLDVGFPASSPNAVSCGGTSLPTGGAEVVWDNNPPLGTSATGGGVSRQFGLPDYQISAGVPFNPDGVPGRGSPDVAGVADPNTGYLIYVGGGFKNFFQVGGTSAVAPLWSALLAISNEMSGKRAGNIHPTIYANPSAFNDITVGNNGGYSAGPGWDACTGLGTPKADEVIRILAKLNAAP